MRCVLLLSMLVNFSCGEGPKKSQVDHDVNVQNSSGSSSDIRKSSTPKSSSDSYMVDIPIKVNSESNFIVKDGSNAGASFNLTALASAYSISIQSCLSGYTGTINQSVTSIKVYKYDKNCVAKLNSFSYDGINYIPSPGFSTWNQGDSAVFANALDSNMTIDVTIVSTLSATIVAEDTVYYRFSNIKKGSTTSGILSATVTSEPALPGASTNAPSFDVYQTSFVGLGPLNEGKFEFILECTPVAISGDTCAFQDMDQMQYKLIEDIYGGILDYETAEDIFQTAGTTVDTNTDLIAEGASGTTNGGFTTKTGGSAIMGPGGLVSMPDMILLLQYDAGAENSYQYFLVRINLQL